MSRFSISSFAFIALVAGCAGPGGASSAEVASDVTPNDCSAAADAAAPRGTPAWTNAFATCIKQHNPALDAGGGSCQSSHHCASGAGCVCDTPGKQGDSCLNDVACFTACTVCADAGAGSSGGNGAADAAPPVSADAGSTSLGDAADNDAADDDGGGGSCQSSYVCAGSVCHCTGPSSVACTPADCDSICEVCN